MPASDRAVALHHVLSTIERYSRILVQTPLRGYQLEPAEAIVNSVVNQKGLTFTVMMSRQAGKNELSAEIEAYLLTLFSRRGGSIVKAAPTFRPQIVNSMLRVTAILNNPLTCDKWATAQGYIIALGKARVFYFSGAPDAQIVGATASLLLEVDEAQDFDPAKYDKDLRPMGASTNATTVLYGTAWTADTLLERVRQENARLEASDGVQRNFTYPWDVVAQENPSYARYVQAEIARLGLTHPLVRTQYLLQTVAGSGRFLTDQQIAQLTATTHLRQSQPDDRASYVAGIDIAGEDEEAEDAALRAVKPRKDSTAVTIARVTWTEELPGAPEPKIEVVEHLWLTGTAHRDLAPRLVDILQNVWRCTSITVDATGVGAGVASLLVGAIGADVVHPFVFSSVSKSDLGYQLLAAVNAGRVKVYATPSEERDELLAEAEQARSELLANQRMRWAVPDSAGHDDLLVSLALTVEAAQHAHPRVATGRVVRRDR